METILKLDKISKIFKEKTPPDFSALKNISLEIGAGEFFMMVGPSGSGKSTLLRVISGLEKDYTGQVVFSPDISPADFSFVFQQFALLPWLNVYENVGIGLVAKKINPQLQKESIMKELKILGLEKFATASIRELSGGMRQRVGLARALVTNPKIIFMDEPFSELDSFTASELRKELLAIWQKRKTTIVMVTHLIEEALELGDRIAVLTPRPGTIESIITNPLPRPRDKRSLDFYQLEDKLHQLIKP